MALHCYGELEKLAVTSEIVQTKRKYAKHAKGMIKIMNEIIDILNVFW